MYVNNSTVLQLCHQYNRFSGKVNRKNVEIHVNAINLWVYVVTTVTIATKRPPTSPHAGFGGMKQPRCVSASPHGKPDALKSKLAGQRQQSVAAMMNAANMTEPTKK